jgi:pimeloyl-ACP methyl ester carboxylesterase
LFVAYPDGAVVRYSEAARPTPAIPQYASALSQYLRTQLAERVADLRFVRNQLKNLKVTDRRVGDFMSDRIGVFGHSSGGLSAALLCQQPPNVHACLKMDGRLDAAPFVTGAGTPEPSRPFMYMTKPFRMLSDAELRAQGITREQATRAQADACERDRRLLATAGPPSYRATLYHAEHNSFSDEPLLLNPRDAKSVNLMRIVRGLIVEFFAATVADRGQKLLALQSNQDLHFEVLARRPGR